MKEHEQIIVAFLKQGDEKAYKYLYDYHYVLLCKMANEFVKDSFIAETIVGDTIFHLWEIRSTLDIKISLRSYLVRSVRNRCINYINLEREQREVQFSLLDKQSENRELFCAASSDYPLATLLEKELEEEILMAISQLPDECREVFIKSRFEDKSYNEIALELGISVNTVKYHIKNALSRLSADLSNYLLMFFIVLREIN